MTKPQHPGIKVKLSDGNDYVIPRLPYPIRADLEKRHVQTIALLQNGEPAPDELAFIRDTVFAALKINYPELTREASDKLIEGKLQHSAVHLVISALCRCDSFPCAGVRHE